MGILVCFFGIFSGTNIYILSSFIASHFTDVHDLFEKSTIVGNLVLSRFHSYKQVCN